MSEVWTWVISLGIEVEKFSKCNVGRIIVFVIFSGWMCKKKFTSQHVECVKGTLEWVNSWRYSWVCRSFCTDWEISVAPKVSEAPEIYVFLQVIRTTWFSSLHRLFFFLSIVSDWVTLSTESWNAWEPVQSLNEGLKILNVVECYSLLFLKDVHLWSYLSLCTVLLRV